MANRKIARLLLRLVRRIPGAYSAIAFLAARRVLVRGWSMHPALRPGDRVLYDRLAYLVDTPRPGDIVLARHPARPGVRMVKRVAAAPGDTFVPEGGAPEPLGRGEFVLLGDSPDASTDSRRLGPFHRRDILARAWIVYWPPERFRRL